jgi:hypothetical protein
MRSLPGTTVTQAPHVPWWRKWPLREWLAAIFGFTTLVLLVIVVAQGFALRMRGWQPALGTIPEAVAAIGTMGALWVAVLVWRHEVTARRADERELRIAQDVAGAAERAARADQARLVILDFEYDDLLDMSTGGAYSYFAATARNLSNRPIFDVQIEVPPDNPQVQLRAHDDNPLNTPTARAIDAHDKHIASYEHVAKEIDWAWLAGVPVLRYTDANGVRWTRTPTGQPQEIIS